MKQKDTNSIKPTDKSARPIKQFRVWVQMTDTIYGTTEEDALEWYRDWLSKHTVSFTIAKVEYVGEEASW